MIRCDMYIHVARCHLDLAQLWRCPVSWCTVWKGAPQDLMDHVRWAHRVPEEVQSMKLETFIPPWTVTRKVYMESLTSRQPGSLEPGCSSMGDSPDVVGTSPRPSRRTFARRRIARVHRTAEVLLSAWLYLTWSRRRQRLRCNRPRRMNLTWPIRHSREFREHEIHQCLHRRHLRREATS